MPIVQVSIAEGRGPEQIRAMIREVTAAVAGTLGAPVPTIRVLVTEVPLTHWGSGEQTLAESRARGDRTAQSTSS